MGIMNIYKQSKWAFICLLVIAGWKGQTKIPDENPNSVQDS